MHQPKDAPAMATARVGVAVRMCPLLVLVTGTRGLAWSWLQLPRSGTCGWCELPWLSALVMGAVLFTIGWW